MVLSAAIAAIPAQAQQAWFAIGVSTTNHGAAQQRANYLGSDWYVMSSNECPNFRRGLWIAVSGPHSHYNAQVVANNARYAGVRDAYVKSCY